MVLVQIIITPENNGSFFPIGVSGLCSLRVLAYDHHDTGNAPRLIQVLSEQLVFPYSPARYLTVMTNQHSTHTVDDSQGGFHLNNVVINGGIQLQVINRATGAQPGGFTFALLTLSVEEINRNKPVDSA
jgi:hypothetical protein